MCHCYAVFGEAVSSVLSFGNQEHYFTEDGQAVAQQIEVLEKHANPKCVAHKR